MSLLLFVDIVTRLVTCQVNHPFEENALFIALTSTVVIRFDRKKNYILLSRQCPWHFVLVAFYINRSN